MINSIWKILLLICGLLITTGGVAKEIVCKFEDPLAQHALLSEASEALSSSDEKTLAGIEELDRKLDYLLQGRACQESQIDRLERNYQAILSGDAGRGSMLARLRTNMEDCSPFLEKLPKGSTARDELLGHCERQIIILRALDTPQKRNPGKDREAVSKLLEFVDYYRVLIKVFYDNAELASAQIKGKILKTIDDKTMRTLVNSVQSNSNELAEQYSSLSQLAKVVNQAPSLSIGMDGGGNRVIHADGKFKNNKGYNEITTCFLAKQAAVMKLLEESSKGSASMEFDARSNKMRIYESALMVGVSTYKPCKVSGKTTLVTLAVPQRNIVPLF